MSLFRKNTLLALALASFSSISWATYSDVNAMLQALRPNAPIIAPQLNVLILSLDGLNPYPIQQRDALFTLAPAADGSLRMVSESTNHMMYATIFDRVEKLKCNEVKTGISSGDQRIAYNPKAYWEKNKAAATATPSKTSTTVTTDAPVAATVTTESAKKADAATKTATKIESKNETKTATKSVTTSKTTALTDDVLPDPKAKDQTTVKVVETKTTTKTTPETTAVVATAETPEVAVDVDTPLIGDILSQPRGAWMQIIGADVWQYERRNVPGYHADMLGMIIGRDHQINDDLFIGIAGGYQQADVDTKGLSGSFLDVKRYNATVYGRYDFDLNFTCLPKFPMFTQLALTLALNNYDNNRYILVPPAAGFGFSNIAHGDFDGWETNAHLEVGYKFTCHCLRIIPKAIIEYSHMEFNNYEEHDAFFLDLNVKYDNMNAFDLGIGAQVDYRNEFNNKVAVIPEAHVYIYHDFINANQVASANFYSGGWAFLSEGATPNSNTLDFGVSLNVHSNNQTMVRIEYDYVTRSDYRRNEAFIKLRHEWV
jgi:outer membrane autotransporter protein